MEIVMPIKHDMARIHCNLRSKTPTSMSPCLGKQPSIPFIFHLILILRYIISNNAATFLYGNLVFACLFGW